MRDQASTNIDLLVHVAKRLGNLADDMVFTGGCVVGLLITDEAAPDVRPTDDVDVIVELVSRQEYYQLEEKLRELGFMQKPHENGLLCRWDIDGVKVDIMPTREEITGLSSPWFLEAWNNASAVTIADSVTVRVVTAPYFLATKLAALFDRADEDYFASPDLEDIVAVIDGRETLLEEIEEETEELRKYLARSFSSLMAKDRFRDALPGHLPHDKISKARIPSLIAKIEQISELV
jgi:hypothetical protein